VLRGWVGGGYVCARLCVGVCVCMCVCVCAISLKNKIKNIECGYL